MSSKPFVLVAPLIVVLTTGLLVTSLKTQSDGRIIVAHDFSTSSQGWLVSGDTGLTAPEFNATGGHPGGYLSNVDEALGETWYFLAPDSLLQQLRTAEHGTLSYDLKQSADEPGFLDDDVVVIGPAGRLSYRFRSSPGTDWTTFSVRLSASAGWRWNWSTPATQEQIRRVLDNPTSLEIRGEYHTGPDEGGLDSVVLRTGG
jgi:Laminin B (Domain IV)